jgi:penicillin amidase
MATGATFATRSRSHAPYLRWIAFVLSACLLAALGAIALGYFLAQSALPQLDGTTRVQGLLAQVSVTRDAHGVPTIEASNLEDLFFAQGYVTAQDRLWQMDVMRRFAAGELAEILGDDFVKHDREQRILGLSIAARKSIEIAPAAQRSQFEAYAKGVNAYIESHRDHPPLEFRILHYSPRLWTPADSSLIGAQMVKDLNHGPYRHALEREKILAKVGPELTQDLYVNSSMHDHPPTTSRTGFGVREKIEEGQRPSEAASPSSEEEPPPVSGFSAIESLDMDQPPVSGSNNWVVSGAHTISGKPLLSNDMHLGHQMPNLWYEAHLHCGDFEATGVTLPGVPYVIVGHNRRIAWGFTNVGPTVEDVYVETFNRNGQYLTPQGWRDPQHRLEVIHRKGKPDLMLDVVLTRHGPITSELVPGETRRLALRWTLYEGTRNPFFELNSAQNWDEFRRAFSKLDAPGQNVVYADVDGNIGYQATGKIPILASGDGSLPANGSDNSHEWIGYIPFEKLPNVFNPHGGIIATANSRITPDGYPYSISTGWEAPWRSARIYSVLESGKRFSTADMLALQTDVYSEWEYFSAKSFVFSVDHAKNPSPRARQAAEILRHWDGRVTADSSAPTIAGRARTELTRLLLEPKLGRAPKDPDQLDATLSWQSYNWPMQSVWLENVIRQRPTRWLPEKYANYDELLTAAVEAAVSDPDEPRDLNSWKWGKFNPVEIQHPILGRIPLLKYWTGPGIQQQSGSGFTVKAVTRDHGPSERMTVDLSNFDGSTLNLVTGQAGNFLSPFYMDQWNAWYQGYTFTLPFSPAAIARTRAHQLVLEPKN